MTSNAKDYKTLSLNRPAIEAINEIAQELANATGKPCTKSEAVLVCVQGMRERFAVLRAKGLLPPSDEF